MIQQSMSRWLKVRGSKTHTHGWDAGFACVATKSVKLKNAKGLLKTFVSEQPFHKF